jgi:acetyl-CoA acetyltransferase
MTVAIVGSADRTYRKHDRPDEWRGVQLELSLEALADAQIHLGDVDCVIWLPRLYYDELDSASVFCEEVGLTPAVADTLFYGGVAAATSLVRASHYLASGQANVALVVAADDLRTRLGTGDAATRFSRSNMHPLWERHLGIPIPGAFALAARRYLHDTADSSSSDLAAPVVSQAGWASLHPQAILREALTVDDVLSDRVIADPLTRAMLPLITDGGCAFVLTRLEDASDRSRAVPILGTGEGCGGQHLVFIDNLTHPPALREASTAAFAMAGLGPGDCDLFYSYDIASIVPILQLETLGFVTLGEGARFFRDGHGAVGGRLPVNTHGGAARYGHSGWTGPLYSIAEAVRQLRGEALGHQVAGAERAAIATVGGLSTYNVTVLGSE